LCCVRLSHFIKEPAAAAATMNSFTDGRKDSQRDTIMPIADHSVCSSLQTAKTVPIS